MRYIDLLNGSGHKPKASVALHLVNRLGTTRCLAMSILLHFIHTKVCQQKLLSH